MPVNQNQYGYGYSQSQPQHQVNPFIYVAPDSLMPQYSSAAAAGAGAAQGTATVEDYSADLKAYPQLQLQYTQEQELVMDHGDSVLEITPGVGAARPSAVRSTGTGQHSSRKLLTAGIVVNTIGLICFLLTNPWCMMFVYSLVPVLSNGWYIYIPFGQFTAFILSVVGCSLLMASYISAKSALKSTGAVTPKEVQTSLIVWLIFAVFTIIIHLANVTSWVIAVYLVLSNLHFH